MLYPLKFDEIFKEKLWGGRKLADLLNKKIPFPATGESWEISSVDDNISVVSEGFLKGNRLDELAEVYMGELLGDSVWSEFGKRFPLLIKFIDAADDLSVQVHPDDSLAEIRYGQNGKNEMWYIADAEPGAELILGFSKALSKQDFLSMAAEEKLSSYLHRQKVKPGDAFFIPAGLVHSIGRGILIAEIQQSSDVTYRIDDRNRTDKDGKKRELHINEAVDAIKFEFQPPAKLNCAAKPNVPCVLFDSEYFSVRFLNLESYYGFDYARRDSFTVYMCLDGQAVLSADEHRVSLRKGETVLLPAVFNSADVQTKSGAKLLEVWI